jgi:hypothetical protein
LRHSFGTEMVRAGVSLLAVMKLLGHLKPEMTMLYVETSLLDLQREFNLARSQPRYLLPASRLPASIRSPQASSNTRHLTILMAEQISTGAERL